MSQQKQVNLSYRQCRIDYEVDMKSVAQMATENGIEWYDMKKALRAYGFVIRKNEPKPADPNKTYVVNLVDTDKIVEPEAVAPKTSVTTTQNA